MTDIHAVFCDVGCVLNHTDWDGLDEHLAAVSDKDVDEVKAIENELRLHHLDTGDISVEEFVKRFKDQASLRLSVAEYKAVLHEYVHWHHDVIDELRGVHIPAYTLSNNSALFITSSRRAWLSDVFDKQFYSHEIGMRKPNRGIYDHALSNVEENPENAVFIDDKKDNLETATDLGLQTHHYTGQDDVIAFLETIRG